MIGKMNALRIEQIEMNNKPDLRKKLMIQGRSKAEKQGKECRKGYVIESDKYLDEGRRRESSNRMLEGKERLSL